MFINDVTVTSS